MAVSCSSNRPILTASRWLVYEVENHNRSGFRCSTDGFVVKKPKEQSPDSF